MANAVTHTSVDDLNEEENSDLAVYDIVFEDDVVAIPPELTIAEGPDDQVEEAAPAKSTLLSTRYPVERGIKALMSDDPDLVQAIAGEITYDYNEAKDEFIMQWPPVNNEPSDFIRLSKDTNSYVIDFSHSPNYLKDGVTADCDYQGRNGSVRRAIGTLRSSNDFAAATLVGSLLRTVHGRRQIEGLLANGLVEDIVDNVKSLLRKNSNIPLKVTADHEHKKEVVAHFWNASERSTSEHFGIVVAKPAEGVLVLNSPVRASFLVHKLDAKSTANIKIGDPVSIQYGVDKRLGTVANVKAVTMEAVAVRHESVQQMKRGRPLEERRAVVFHAGASSQFPDAQETPLDSRKLPEKSRARDKGMDR